MFIVEEDIDDYFHKKIKVHLLTPHTWDVNGLRCIRSDKIGLESQHPIWRTPSAVGTWRRRASVATVSRPAFRLARTRRIGFEKSFPSLNGQRQQRRPSDYVSIKYRYSHPADRYRQAYVSAYICMYVRPREYIYFSVYTTLPDGRQQPRHRTIRFY